MSLAPDDPRHGTNNGYGNLGCRCRACCEARTTYFRENGYSSYKRDTCPSCGGDKTTGSSLCDACYRDTVRVEHGTEGAYNRGCSCDDCRRAAAAARRRRRAADPEAARAYDREYKRRYRRAVA